MKKQQYNDDALYQEIMASLEPDAAEYDRMMASGEAPAKRKKVSSLPSRNRKATTVKWYAAAAAVVGLLVVTATLFLGRQDMTKHTASTIPASEGKHLAETEAAVPHMENADSDLHRLTAKIETIQEQQPLYHTPQKSIYTAMLPEVDFCPESDDAVRSNAVSNDNVRLPQVRKERSFALVCNVILPDITAYADSTIFTSSTELMVACDEISYNDSNF